MERVRPDKAGVEHAASVIRAGGIVAYPTETLYGLGVNPFLETALKALFDIKGRSQTNPILLIAADAAQVAQVVAEISPVAQRYIDTFWPGPLSLVLPRKKTVPAMLCGSTGKVCVRVPSSEVARALCAAVGHPITSTSANRSGDAPARDVDSIALDGVVLCIDGGLLPSGPPSTVFDPDTGVVHRHGAINEERLKELLLD